MDIQILRKFLAVAKAGSITKAADALHISQPPLSRQLHDLEAELGTHLFERTNRRTALTPDGLLLEKRAEEILSLVEKTQSELQNARSNIKGDIYIGAGESAAMSYIAKRIAFFQKEHPLICYHITSSDGEDLREWLDKGLIDFALFIGEWDIELYDYITLPFKNRWGAVMPSTHPLAQKDAVTAKDLIGEPLLLPRQVVSIGTLDEWFGRSAKELNVAGTFNLAYNALMFCRGGLGVAITLDKLLWFDGFDTPLRATHQPYTDGGGLCFRPLESAIYSRSRFAWKKGQVFSQAAKCFLEFLQGDADRGE